MAKLKTVDIKGKPYVTVNERLKYFRETHAHTFGLVSEIVSMDESSVAVKASIVDMSGMVVATGHASEDRNASMINKTSYLENAETSAWGRCLANFGIGIDANVASADELVNALDRQEALTKKVDKNKIAALRMKCDEKGSDIDQVLTYLELKSIEDMTVDQWVDIMARLDKKVKK